MSNDIVSQDPNLDRIRALTQVDNPSGGISFPTGIAEASRLTDTYVIAHYDGEGASTLALFLAQFLPVAPVIMEIGTNASRAFKSLPKDRVFRTPAGDPTPVNVAMNERLRRPSSPAILEVGRTHYREAIDIATTLQNPPLAAPVYFCFLASENDRELKIPRLAHDRGVEKIIVFGGYKLGREIRRNVIKIPTIPEAIQRLMYEEGRSLRDAVNASEDRYSALLFMAEFEVFGLAVKGALKA